MTRLLSILALGSLLCLSFTGGAFADEEEEDHPFYGIDFSGGVAFATDYRFRGISQTSNNPALQGNVDIERIWEGEDSSIGIYAGMWASTLNFADGTDPSYLEWDFYGGLSGELFGISGTIGALYYWYPATPQAFNYDYLEIPISLGYTLFDAVDLGVGYAYSPDYYAASGSGHYVSFTAGMNPFPDSPFNPGIDVSYGYQAVEDNVALALPDWHDWSVGLTAEVLGFGLDVRYIQTSISTGACGSDACGATGTFTLSRSF